MGTPQKTTKTVAAVAIAFAVAGCASDAAPDTTTSTTTTAPAATTTGARTTTAASDSIAPPTTAASTTTEATAQTRVPGDNPTNAEAMLDAIYGSDDAALSDLPWGNSQVAREAMERREFEVSLNVELLEASCVNSEPNLVSCDVLTDDDLMEAIGADFNEDAWNIRFTASGEIAQFESEIAAGSAAEAFFSWAFETYPNLCNTPAQCASALLEIVNEYLDA